LFAIDPRSLALFRIAMGALLLVDLAVRASDLNVMYTDDGMFSRAEICRRATTIWNWSFHFASGAPGYQGMLFGIAGALAIALLVGFETRLAAIGSWLMLVSIQHRVPPILSGAEVLLRMLLFWAMFLPLGRAWSLDGWLAQRRGNATPDARAPVLSVASATIMLQMGLMYLFSAIFKSNAQWLHGQALAGILVHDFYASPPAAFFLQFPRLLTAMTCGTLILEWAAPVLLFFPRATARLRLAVIAALVVMHLGISLCLEVGLFSYVALAGLALFLPAEFWNSRLIARFSRKVERAAPLENAVRHLARKRPPLFYVSQGVCLLAFVYILAVNLNSFPSRPLAPLAPERWRPMTRGLGLSQSWGMFGEIPSRDGWYVARAKLNDGSEVDLLRHGAPIDWARPEFPARLYPNYFWQKLFREMAYDDEQGFQLMRAPVAQYLCRDWNARNPPNKQIAEFELIYCMLNKAEAKNAATPPISREQLVRLDLGEL